MEFDIIIRNATPEQMERVMRALRGTDAMVGSVEAGGSMMEAENWTAHEQRTVNGKLPLIDVAPLLHKDYPDEETSGAVGRPPVLNKKGIGVLWQLHRMGYKPSQISKALHGVLGAEAVRTMIKKIQQHEQPAPKPRRKS